MNKHEIAAKQTIERLIQVACNFDFDALDKIYHEHLDIVMIHDDGTVNKANKESFTQVFKDMQHNGSPPVNDWAKFHHVEADDKNARVVLTRRNNIAGTDMELTLSIDLVYEQNRWQALREIIFLRPDTHKAAENS